MITPGDILKRSEYEGAILDLIEHQEEFTRSDLQGAVGAIVNKIIYETRAAEGTKEKIAHEAGKPEAWICLCGNRPSADGFFPCDKAGDEMEPVADWEDLYVCAKCGRIIHQTTLEIVGRNPHPKLP